jgi:thiol-disulfide isomerase/thioredoxin
MRPFLTLILLSSLVLSFSNCSGVSSEGSEGNSNLTNTSNQPNVGQSQFPLLPEKIANAEMEMIDGSVQRLSDRKGKVVLVNLWGVWCGPCRDEMPHLAALQEKYRDKDFQVIGLNIGDADFEPENIDVMKEFATEMNVNYELARIPNSLTREYNRMTKFDGVPLSVLIDREGRMRGVFLGGGTRVINSMKKTVEKVVNE